MPLSNSIKNNFIHKEREQYQPISDQPPRNSTLLARGLNFITQNLPSPKKSNRKKDEYVRLEDERINIYFPIDENKIQQNQNIEKLSSMLAGYGVAVEFSISSEEEKAAEEKLSQSDIALSDSEIQDENTEKFSDTLATSGVEMETISRSDIAPSDSAYILEEWPPNSAEVKILAKKIHAASGGYFINGGIFMSGGFENFLQKLISTFTP